jgi:hypothetical protein
VADVHRHRRGNREGDRVGDVFRLRQLEALDEALVGFRRVAVHVREDVGGHAARADLRHAHALAEHVDAQLARQHAHRGLGRVIDAVAVEVVRRRDRADVDDVAAVALHHAGNHESAKVQHGTQVHVDQQVDVCRLPFQQSAGPVHACAVDQDVEGDVARELREPLKVGDVEHVGDAAGFFGQRQQAVPRARDGMHFQPFGAQAPHHGRPDARGGTGDEGSSVVGKRHGRDSGKWYEFSERLAATPRRNGCVEIRRPYYRVNP